MRINTSKSQMTVEQLAIRVVEYLAKEHDMVIVVYDVSEEKRIRAAIAARRPRSRLGLERLSFEIAPQE